MNEQDTRDHDNRIYQEPYNRPIVECIKGQPHVCPLCKGCGAVPESFYNPPDPFVYQPSTTCGETYVPCRACGGMGVIWG